MIKFKLAICQIQPGYDKEQNIQKALHMLGQAAQKGATLIMFPELFYYPYELEAVKLIAEEHNETLSRLQEVALKHKIFLCTGSMAQKKNTEITNTAYLIDPNGKILLSHSKCHLFDVNFKEVQCKESAVFSSGFS